MSDDKLRQFLRRKRRGAGTVQPPELGNFLGATLEMATRLVPSNGACLLLDHPELRRDAAGSPLIFVSVVGPGARGMLGLQISSRKGIEGRVYRKGITLVRGSKQRRADLQAQVDDLAPFRGQSMVAVPVRLEQAVCGVLLLIQRRDQPSYSDRDLQLAELFAGYISRAILNAVDIIKQNELAQYDPLTNIFNVRNLMPLLEAEIRKAQNSGDDLSVMFIDLDHLKPVNDRYGHQFGSEAIKRAAQALQDTVGGDGTVFRFGGDEFVVILPRTDVRAAESIAGDLLKAIRKHIPGPMPEGGKIPKMTASIGIATLRSSLSDRLRNGKKRPSAASRLLTVADRALYRAKRLGRARVAKGTRRDDR
jgi:diguanylate cyclase (GGDEF)-like protein